MSAMPISFIDRTKADWTLQRDACLVELLIEQQNAGNRSDTGWKKEAWKYMVDAFNRRFGIDNNVQQLKSRIAQLKKNYNIVRQLLNQSGFSWNNILHVVVADDDVWDRYLLLHPEAKPFRKAGLPLFEELGTLFDACKSMLSVHLESENGRNIPGPQRTPCHSTAAMPLSGEDSDEVTLSSEQEIQLEDPRRYKRSTSSSKMSHGKRRRVGTGNRIAMALEGIVSASVRLAESAQMPLINDDS
ncbi:hypothetical protein AAC387_Pa11g0161 [Persea americana]